MKIIISLILFLLTISLQAETTNQDLSKQIVNSLTNSNGVTIPETVLKNLIDDITYLLDEKDKAIDYNYSIALDWKKKYEDKERIKVGFSLGVQLQGLSPSFGGSVIILF
jgi:hypothetical protein